MVTNGLEYRNADWHVNSGKDLAKPCKNLGKLRSSNTRDLSTYFENTAKLAYLAKYLRMFSTDLQIFSVGRSMEEDDKSDISFAVDQGTLLW